MSERAQQIDKVRVKAGRLIRVVNTQKPKLSSANAQYYAVWVEDADGGNERCLLFTDKQIEAAATRASRNPEDLPKKGKLVDMFD